MRPRAGLLSLPSRLLKEAQAPPRDGLAHRDSALASGRAAPFRKAGPLPARVSGMRLTWGL